MNAQSLPTLTALEAIVMGQFHDFEFCADVPGTPEMGTWGECFTAEFAGRTGKSTRSATGVLSSLIKKGLLRSEVQQASDNSTWITITEQGFAVWQSLQAPAEVTIDDIEDGATDPEAGEAAPVAEPTIAEEAPSVEGMTARQRVVQASTPGSWVILGTDLVVKGKRPALRLAAEVKRAEQEARKAL